MSTKNIHTMRHFAAWAREAQRQTGRFVTAGEVARLTGVSTNTAKKWLWNAYLQGELQSGHATHKNGLSMVVYGLDSIQTEINGKVE